MDPEEVARLVKKLTLSNEANQPSVTISAAAVEDSVRHLKGCLVGKIFSAKATNRETLIIQLPKILQARSSINIEIVGDNIFIADFSSLVDRKRVLHDGPWHFFNSLMVFQEPQDLQNPYEMVFDDFTVWVQLHNLPLIFMHYSVLSEIGEQIGKVHEIDMGADGSCMGKFARIRVTRSLKKPLQRCLNISLNKEGASSLILLLYERLPDFCYACGRVGHVHRDCVDACLNITDPEFGPWMRAGRSDFVRPRASTRSGPEGCKESDNSLGVPIPLKKIIMQQPRDQRAPPLKSIAERELEEGPNLSIIPVKKVALVGEEGIKMSGGVGTLSEDITMESLGLELEDAAETSVQRKNETSGLKATNDLQGVGVSHSTKMRWKKKARDRKVEDGENDKKEGHNFAKTLFEATSDKRGCSDMEENMVAEDTNCGVKRLKSGLSKSLLNLAPTAETAEQSRRAQ